MQDMVFTVLKKIALHPRFLTLSSHWLKDWVAPEPVPGADKSLARPGRK